ncbi:uncharacterized protein SPAPADRAFT_47748 [Spathaspora passalidarum NRRL Y-27907]|uniref:Flavoprotein domain-containing protein n=1 Tax=Spathaspora passalidarum (strain NRRL Y-27907 / 11-Y1) TaxID=619300 RepID=G3AGY6_SPAPN|nr:uncharacterized protein SPAPADRAFT_47748 [Spathaspora passalidarum NRRL Y-27907]EGW34659.1 hypothetical protein SPAPADRAFT_47748 [Spathaspora passalidarum NRRL Y-27907]
MSNAHSTQHPKLAVDTTTAIDQSQLSPSSTKTKGKNVLHSPIPKKPAMTDQLKSNLESTPKPLTSNHSNTKRDKLPSLVVKQDPNLKSCLSQPSESTTSVHLQQKPFPPSSSQPQEPAQPRTGSSDMQPQRRQSNPPILHHTLDADHHLENQHPQFVTTDSVSPTMHGLLNSQSRLVTSPINLEQVGGGVTPVTVVQAPSQPGSVSSSAISKSASPIQQQNNFPSRVNSLRYNDNDKKYIDFVRHSANNNSISSTSVNNVATTEEKGVSPIQHPITGPEDDKLHLLIGITGCISIHQNIVLIIEKLFELYTHDKLEIQIILTKSAEWFLSDKLTKLEQLGVSKVWFSDDGEKYFLTSPFQQAYSNAAAAGSLGKHKLTAPQLLQQYSLSYKLQRWTDVLLLAPLSANTVAKLTTGIADNLLTELLHVWPIPQVPQQQSSIPIAQPKQDTTVMSYNILSPKPIIAALAFTSAMYSHPITKKQLALLQETYPNMSILKPVEKCVDIDGNISMGGMRTWREVVDFVCKKLGPPSEPEVDEDDNVDEEEENDEKDLKENDDDDEEDEDEDEEDEDNEDSSIPEYRPEAKPSVSPVIPKSSSKSPQPTKAKLEIHDDDEKLEPIIDSRKSSATGEAISANVKEPQTRRRSNTISNKELQEHEKLASQNAILNAGIGIGIATLPAKCASANSIND